MTLPQNVEDALNFFYRDEAPSDEESWLKVIRAHLISQEAEIARVKSIADAHCDGRLTAIARLAAANALLRSEAALLRAWARESREGGWSTHQYEPMLRRANELDDHLQGAGDEATN